MPDTKRKTILLAESEVVTRLALAEYLRGCGLKVLEATSGAEAKAVLQAGFDVDVLFSDAELAGPDSGFALAQWVRRYRRHVQVILTGSVAHKAQSAVSFCSDPDADADSAALAARIHAMAAELRRRSRPATSSASHGVHRRRRLV